MTSYRLLHIIYTAVPVAILLSLGLMMLMGFAESDVNISFDNSDYGTQALFLVFVVLAIFLTSWQWPALLLAAIIIWKHRDWKVAWPLAVYLAGALTIYVAAPELMSSKAYGLIAMRITWWLAAITAGWLSWHWFRNGYALKVQEK
ncbi:MAG: hypothetical protein OQK99_06325 [Gammaproteobacteria bacterium]|jgi:hypothetical protein|nr:hypothetical protein [Gammaproteobacteria bacterium]